MTRWAGRLAGSILLAICVLGLSANPGSQAPGVSQSPSSGGVERDGSWVSIARADTGAPRALVRVDVRGAADLGLVKDSSVPVHGRFWGPAGAEYLLALADPAQQKALSSRGLVWCVLDPDSEGATYYLLTARRPEALDHSQVAAALLDRHGRQAIARLNREQAAEWAALGMEIQRLSPRPIVLEAEGKLPILPQAVTPDPTIAQMIDEVSSTAAYDLDGDLSGEAPVMVGGEPYTIQSRNTYRGTPMQKATQFAYERFVADGLTASYHQWNDATNPNVIGELTGTVEPDRIFLVTAHLDDMPVAVVAPGADDNASGSVGVLIAAEILSHYQFGNTLRFVLFTGEEYGLFGSNAYADWARAQGQNIEAVLNLDMIAYNSDSSPIVDLHTRSGTAGAGDRVIANLFSDVVGAYGINLVPEILQDGDSASDHASFWGSGFPAILAIEDDDDFTPYYHTTSDRRSTLDMTFFTNFIKAAVGTAAHMGGTGAVPVTCYNLTLTHTGTGSDPIALPSSSPGCTSGKFVAGGVASLIATPAAGQKVGSWTGTDNDASTAKTNTVTMPAADHAAAVNYVAGGGCGGGLEAALVPPFVAFCLLRRRSRS